MNKTNKFIKFYKSKAWRDKRKEILIRDNYECQRCKSLGKVKKAQAVHHIKHLKDRWDLRLDDDNLISLCNVCHNLEHPEKLQHEEMKNIHKARFR